jgi:hypothetical protein
MNINLNHPSFIAFLENMTNNILSNVTVENYFKISTEKKLGIQYMVFKLIKSSISHRAKLSDDELKSFLVVLWKRNEESENYEFAGILRDITNNFDTVSEHITQKTIKRKIKTKTDNTENG